MRSLIAIILITFANITVAQGIDTNEGYYYPKVTSQEAFNRVLLTSPKADKDVRTGFATSITLAQLAAPESPRYVIFAKGGDAEKLVIIALDDQVFLTLYRARAVLAQLTSNLRGNNFLGKQDLKDEGTFYDLLQLMQFKTLVISDGATWAHRVTFAPE
ncbi:MAG: hypothetical protein IME92_02270 [Proteobacteria bacterium]|nr:hypothetical protein [Pseudomonadota bacterium]